MRNNPDYTLCLVTDRELLPGGTLNEAVEKAIIGGCTMVQLREKKLTARAFYEIAASMKNITSKYHIPLIINDRADIALAADADGVHIGQNDLPAPLVRKLMGGKIMGVSASCLTEALQAERDGADYIGVGAMYKTGTKTDARLVSMDELIKIRNAVSIPIVVIGGINQKTVPAFAGTGINGLAVVSAIMARKDAEEAAAELLRLFRGDHYV